MKSFDWTRFVFFCSLLLAAYGFGMTTAELKIFPHRAVRRAGVTATSLMNSFRANRQSDVAFNSRETLSEPAVRRHAGVAGTELILVSGGKNYQKDHSPDYGALAWIMDREGTVRHVWHFARDFWDDLKNVSVMPGKPIYPVGLHLFPNGDLLVTFQGIDSWPYGIGIAKVDKDSNLLWKRELNNHHWFMVSDDGRIYVPAQHIVDSPYYLKGRHLDLEGVDGKLLSDTVMVLDSTGSIIDEISMIDALVDADRVGLLNTEPDWDPIHLNDVRIVRREDEAIHPALKAGDLLVSLRDLSTLGVLDVNTKRFKWLSSGIAAQQHSPRFFANGVLVFDNLGGFGKDNGSRLVWIDMLTNDSKTVFPPTEVTLPDPFISKYAGHIDISPDGRRLLVTLTYSGSIWEIDPSSNEVPWQYVYAHKELPGVRRSFHTAKYVPNVSFPLNCNKDAP